MRRRIALRGGEIRTIDGDVASQAKDSIDVVIVNAAPVAVLLLGVIRSQCSKGSNLLVRRYTASFTGHT